MLSIGCKLIVLYNKADYLMIEIISELNCYKFKLLQIYTLNK